MIKVVETPVWKQFLADYKLKGQKRACIAYVTGTTLPLSKGDVLLCDASLNAISTGKTSATTLKQYFEKGVTIYSNQYLHSKFIVCDNYALVGSANFSSNSTGLREAALVTDDTIAIAQCKALCHIYIEDAYTEIIDERRIAELLKIKVVRRGGVPVPKVKVKKLGQSSWYLRCIPLSERAYSNFEGSHEKAKSTYSKKYNLEREDIELLKWRADTEFGRSCKYGDMLIMRWGEKGSRKSVVYPPSVILGIEPDGENVLIYHNGSNSEERKLSYSSFKEKIKKMGIKKGYNARIMKVSASELEKIKSIWE